MKEEIICVALQKPFLVQTEEKGFDYGQPIYKFFVPDGKSSMSAIIKNARDFLEMDKRHYEFVFLAFFYGKQNLDGQDFAEIDNFIGFYDVRSKRYVENPDIYRLRSFFHDYGNIPEILNEIQDTTFDVGELLLNPGEVSPTVVGCAIHLLRGYAQLLQVIKPLFDNVSDEK